MTLFQAFHSSLDPYGKLYLFISYKQVLFFDFFPYLLVAPPSHSKRSLSILSTSIIALNTANMSPLFSLLRMARVTHWVIMLVIAIFNCIFPLMSSLLHVFQSSQCSPLQDYVVLFFFFFFFLSI